MADYSVQHGTFVVERTFPNVTTHRVFEAWANPDFKAQWFGGSPEQENRPEVFEFKVGGREYDKSKMGDDEYTFDVVYRDIVPDNRIIYTYEMSINGKRMSVSVAAIELFPADGATRMKVTEHGVFLDGLDTIRQREMGTNFIMDTLGRWLAEHQG